MRDTIIKMGHGSGAKLTNDLIKEVFDKNFNLPGLEDGIEIENRTVVSTDSHVIKPLFFPGGDIGKLAVNGTVNDVAMKGAVPKYLLITYIIEEGLPIADLKKITKSVQKAAENAGVRIIAGDTKVVERGKADGVYITTTGIGYLPDKIDLSASKIQDGNEILINGALGEHSVAIINARENMDLQPPPESDCDALNHLAQEMIKLSKVNFMRDITRGGLATILNEIYQETNLGIIIEAKNIPVNEQVDAICEMLGLDPLYLANEGKFVAIMEPDNKNMLKQIRNNALAKNAAIIGKVTKDLNGVFLRTEIGSLRPLLMQDSDPLPRIC